jgi:hypothetical protein
MSRVRVRNGWSVGICCLFVFFLTLPLASPAPVSAYWDPKITAGPPKDPGTPFEEPESGDPTSSGSGLATRPGGPQPAVTSNVTGELAKSTIQSLVARTLILILVHP